jgi:hypothetical protein
LHDVNPGFDLNTWWRTSESEGCQSLKINKWMPHGTITVR